MAKSIDELVAHCKDARFTGILRIRAQAGIGEVWFLSGVADEVHFGVSTGDEAMGRMRQATEATFELVSRLPHPGGGFQRRFPAKGSVATATPVTLMRYCESYALTCTLWVESRGVLVEATYELGDLVKVETTADDDGITAMLEAQEGTYEFTLPRVELPAGTPVLPPAPKLESLVPPEPVGVRALLDAKPAALRPASDEAAVKRKTVEIAQRQKKAATPTASVPRPVAAAKPAPEAKPAAAPPVEKREEPRAAVPKEDKPPEPAPADVPPPAPAPEAKPAAVPQVKDKREEPPAAAPKEDKPPEPTVPASARSEPEPVPESQPAPLPPPTPTPMNLWLLLLALVVLATGYLYWTNRF